MFKNVAAKFIVFAFDRTTGAPKTGDAANITAYVSKDYGAVTVLADTTATEQDATNAPGYYLFDAAQGETNGDCLQISGKSSTASIVVVGAPAVIYTRPTTGWLAPTTAGRTLDVSAGGEAGVDWANVGSPTTALALTGTTIATTQKVDVETIKTQAVTAAAGVTFPSSIASPTNITAGTITTATNLTNAPTAGDFTATMKTSIGTAVAASAVASVTGNVGGNVTGSVGSVAAGGITASSIAADAITAAKIADGAIDAATFAAGAITATVLGNDAITAAKIADGAIDANTFAAGAINASAIAADAITGAKIADGAIDAATFAAGAIDAAAIAPNAIGASELAADAVSEIAAGVRTELAAELARVDVATSTRASQTSVDTIDDFVDTEVAAIKAKTDNLPSDPADASDVAAAFSTVNSTLATIAGYVDTEVGAIKVVTDKLATAIELDGSEYRFTTNALEQAPTGGSAPTAVEIADEVQTRTIAAVTTVNGLAANTVNASALATDAVTEIQSGLATASALATVAGYVDTEVAAIKAKTDNLPADPADASDIAAAFGTVNTTLATIAGYLDTEIAAIKAKTDNLPSDPADASDLAALLAALSVLATAIKAKTDNLPADPADASDVAALISAVGSIVTAIKAKTDNLPATPAATGDAMTLTAGERGSIADKLLTRHTAGGSDVAGLNARNVTNALRNGRNRTEIVAGVVNVYEEDDTTLAWSGVGLTAAGDPIVSVNPA